MIKQIAEQLYFVKRVVEGKSHRKAIKEIIESLRPIIVASVILEALKFLNKDRATTGGSCDITTSKEG